MRRREIRRTNERGMDKEGEMSAFVKRGRKVER